ncbi:hypothetical protein BY996DRAFT_6424213 [Phakopsora pachyrhizi]|nr:hypothetical protein BY996DRAFT_6424213 [Phakopsora pachyrhizi]
MSASRILNLTSSKGVRIQLKCVGCGQTILSLGEPNRSIRWFALPSEDRQGFIEYWICHDENDQHQSDGSGKIRDKKKGMSELVKLYKRTLVIKIDGEDEDRIKHKAEKDLHNKESFQGGLAKAQRDGSEGDGVSEPCQRDP